MSVDCSAHLFVGIPLTRSDFYEDVNTGEYSCHCLRPQKLKKPVTYCSDCGQKFTAITKLVFTDLFLDYCENEGVDPGKTIETWEDDWDNDQEGLGFHTVDPVSWAGVNPAERAEIFGIEVLATASQRRHDDDDPESIGLPELQKVFKRMNKLAKRFYSDWDVDVYLSMHAG